MAYEYVEAESLDVVLRREARPVEGLAWILALADAVDAAHALGLVHGALHLRDVLVTSEGVCATGFGIASALEHVRLGFPVRRPYTAPEVTAGRRWGPPADRFAVAVLAYEFAHRHAAVGGRRRSDCRPGRFTAGRRRPRGTPAGVPQRVGGGPGHPVGVGRRFRGGTGAGDRRRVLREPSGGGARRDRCLRRGLRAGVGGGSAGPRSSARMDTATTRPRSTRRTSRTRRPAARAAQPGARRPRRFRSPCPMRWAASRSRMPMPARGPRAATTAGRAAPGHASRRNRRAPSAARRIVPRRRGARGPSSRCGMKCSGIRWTSRGPLSRPPPGPRTATTTCRRPRPLLRYVRWRPWWPPWRSVWWWRTWSARDSAPRVTSASA